MKFNSLILCLSATFLVGCGGGSNPEPSPDPVIPDNYVKASELTCMPGVDSEVVTTYCISKEYDVINKEDVDTSTIEGTLLDSVFRASPSDTYCFDYSTYIKDEAAYKAFYFPQANLFLGKRGQNSHSYIGQTYGEVGFESYVFLIQGKKMSEMLYYGFDVEQTYDASGNYFAMEVDLTFNVPYLVPPNEMCSSEFASATGGVVYATDMSKAKSLWEKYAEESCLKLYKYLPQALGRIESVLKGANPSYCLFNK